MRDVYYYCDVQVRNGEVEVVRMCGAEVLFNLNNPCFVSQRHCIKQRRRVVDMVNGCMCALLHYAVVGVGARNVSFVHSDIKRVDYCNI